MSNEVYTESNVVSKPTFHLHTEETLISKYNPHTGRYKLEPEDRCIKRLQFKTFQLLQENIGTDSRMEFGMLVKSGKSYNINEDSMIYYVDIKSIPVENTIVRVPNSDTAIPPYIGIKTLKLKDRLKILFRR